MKPTMSAKSTETSGKPSAIGRFSTFSRSAMAAGRTLRRSVSDFCFSASSAAIWLRIVRRCRNTSRDWRSMCRATRAPMKPIDTSAMLIDTDDDPAVMPEREGDRVVEQHREQRVRELGGDVEAHDERAEHDEQRRPRGLQRADLAADDGAERRGRPR